MVSAKIGPVNVVVPVNSALLLKTASLNVGLRSIRFVATPELIVGLVIEVPERLVVETLEKKGK